MSEESLAKILFEAAKSNGLAWHHIEWDEMSPGSMEAWDRVKQAVIAEFLRRNGEPVAWYEKAPNIDVWFLAYSCNPNAETKPLYFAAPQSLPTVEEIAKVLANSYHEQGITLWELYIPGAVALLALLKGRK